MWLSPVRILLFYKSPSPTLLAKEDPAVSSRQSTSKFVWVFHGSVNADHMLWSSAGIHYSSNVIPMTSVRVRRCSVPFCVIKGGTTTPHPAGWGQAQTSHTFLHHPSYRDIRINMPELFPAAPNEMSGPLFMWQEFLWISPWSSQSWALFMQPG